MNWTPIVVTILIIGSITIAALIIMNKIRDFSRQIFGTDSLIRGFRNQREHISETPKSVSSMSRIFLPQIERDFPEFNYEEFKIKSENMLISALSAVTNENEELVINGSDEIKAYVSYIIKNNQAAGQREVFRDIKIYQTEITDYKKHAGTCVITLQSAVGHIHYIEKNGEIINGSETFPEQCRYNTDIIYIQDVDKLISTDIKSVGTNCPNCGAPIKNLGSKYCDYCGTGVRVVNINVWSINNYKKI